MSSAIHLFKLARFNSEIKCVLYCVDRQYPPYTQPVITDSERWKVDILKRLSEWRSAIPPFRQDSQFYHISLLCEIRYHELVMLVLRPSPRFNAPDRDSLQGCFSSAVECSKLYHKLYSLNSLQYGWVSVHSLFLCVIVILYCAWTPGVIADETDFSALMIALKSSSNVLSAMGEHWPEAKRSRDILDHISTTFIGLFTPKLNPVRSNPDSRDVQSSMDGSSAMNTEQQGHIRGMNLASNSVPLPLFEDDNMADTPFTPIYGAYDTSFTSADILSYFLGSEIDMTSTGFCNLDIFMNSTLPNTYSENIQGFEPPP